jgi:phenazine biosynthesis protein phzE
MTQTPAVRDLLEQIQGYGAWAVIRRKASPTAGLIGGTPHEVASLLDIPLETGAPEPGRSADRLVAVPFRQVRERGFAAIDDGAPLTVVDIEAEHEVAVDDLLAALPDVPVEFADRGGFATSDEDYGKVVEAIIRDEIGQGEGANLVIGRHYRAIVADWDASRALTVLRRLMERERGAYWTFCFYTGDRFLIGASPERHVSVRQGDVRMNPISGTFRVAGHGDALKERLLDFLADEKEVFELFMVVDEELKMMCDICHEGGQVLGPFLKPMTHLIHTEYLLAGRSDREGRGYYGAALALFGRSPDGTPTMDSPILIRTADVSPSGELKVTAGATLVRDSDAAYEVAETRAKAGGILSAFGLAPAATSDGTDIAELARDEDVVLALGTRNQRLSRFWLTDQAGEPADPGLAGKSVVILHGEDDFVNMLVHVLGVFGMTSRVVRHEDYETGAFDGADLVIVGPGPGDPREGDHPKIASFRRAVDDLLASGQPFLAVCLGHQTLCQRLGLDLGYKDVVFQGTQSPVRLDGRTERVGFYNTFVGRVPAGATLPDGVRVEADEATGDIHAVVGPHYRGIQFHAESILTENGYDLLHTAVRDLLA